MVDGRGAWYVTGVEGWVGVRRPGGGRDGVVVDGDSWVVVVVSG